MLAKLSVHPVGPAGLESRGQDLGYYAVNVGFRGAVIYDACSQAELATQRCIGQIHAASLDHAFPDCGVPPVEFVSRLGFVPCFKVEDGLKLRILFASSHQVLDVAAPHRFRVMNAVFLIFFLPVARLLDLRFLRVVQRLALPLQCDRRLGLSHFADAQRTRTPSASPTSPAPCSPAASFTPSSASPIPSHPRAKAQWVRNNVLYLASHLHSCRQVADAFNRWQGCRATVGKSWVAHWLKTTQRK